MSIFERFIDFIKKENLFQPGEPLLLAVSGGVDSVVLCELCSQAGFRFVVAHCNFRLRDEESERDREFVSALAKKYGVDFLLREFDTKEYAAENKLSIQETARKLRYDWFNELILQIPLNTDSPKVNWILTAHHADDNIETMLMNFFRGTGIQGIRGIKSKHGKIIRPLLPFRKEELVKFANEHFLNWVEDSSNESEKYSRNYFRRNIIPLIQNIYPEVEQNLLNNLQRFGDIELLYRQAVNQHKEKLLEQKGNEVHIPVLKLKKTQPLVTIVYEIIKEFGFTSAQAHEVIKLMDSETGKFVQSSTHHIFKNRSWLIISPKAAGLAENIVIAGIESKIHFELGELQFDTSTKAQNKPQNTNHKLQTTNLVAQLNEKEISFPLILRKWKTGDYFYPLGMKKKKKLSRFFIDQKLSKTDKENVWVIEMNKKIIWIVGMRIDERFKITDSTASIFSITLKRQ